MGESSSLSGVVLRSLDKNRSQRYQAVTDLLGDLSNATASPAKATSQPDVPSIAVLPFSDMSATKDQDYFCEGMAEEIINALTKLDGLKVASRTSAFQFKGQSQDIRRIGDALNVRTVLEGSVRTAGTRLRVTAQLINIADGYHLWSERYDRTMEDVFDIQDEIARAIASALQLQLVGDTAVPKVDRYTDDLDAYHLFLQGRHFQFDRPRGWIGKALRRFEHAFEKDRPADTPSIHPVRLWHPVRPIAGCDHPGRWHNQREIIGQSPGGAMRRSAACGSARIPTGILATVTVVVSLMLVPVAGQAQPATTDTWTPLRTAWGEPDLQGIWDFRTLTSLERPIEHAGQEVFTEKVLPEAFTSDPDRLARFQREAEFLAGLLTDNRRCAPTSVHVRRNPRSQSLDPCSTSAEYA